MPLCLQVIRGVTHFGFTIAAIQLWVVQQQAFPSLGKPCPPSLLQEQGRQKENREGSPKKYFSPSLLPSNFGIYFE